MPSIMTLSGPRGIGAMTSDPGQSGCCWTCPCAGNPCCDGVTAQGRAAASAMYSRTAATARSPIARWIAAREARKLSTMTMRTSAGVRGLGSPVHGLAGLGSPVHGLAGANLGGILDPILAHPVLVLGGLLLGGYLARKKIGLGSVWGSHAASHSRSKAMAGRRRR